MRRRLDLAVSLIATPPVLFLDEPTTGLDPRSRVELWDVLRELVRDGTTLLLTTQYLEEADQLADRIVVIDHGRIIAEGTPLELKDQSGQAALVADRLARRRPAAAARGCSRRTSSEVHVDDRRPAAHRPGRGAARHDPDRRGLRATARIELDDLGLKRPSLDDVFLHLTGHRAEDADRPTPETRREESR